MHKATWFMGLAFSGLLSVFSMERAAACAFHGYTPNPTLVDLLLITEQVVLARPDAESPGRYVPVETLLGPLVREIPVPVDPEAKAQIKRNPSEIVLLVRDGSYGPWLEILVLDQRFRALVHRIMERQSAWMYGNDADRVALFAAYVNDPNPGIRRLALQELDRAPYAALQGLEIDAVVNLRQDLARGEEDLMPIRILLAGLSQDRSYAPYLSAELDAALLRDVPYAGAYATALIELEGAAAVDEIVARHLTSGTLSLVAQERLLEALALQYKTAPRPTRSAISANLAKLMRSSPKLGASVARQFGFESRGRLTTSD